MEPFLTSPTASVAVVEATSKSSDAGGGQLEDGNGRAEALVPDAVPLEDSGDALEPPAKRVCSLDTFATPPNKAGKLDLFPLEPEDPHTVVHGRLDLPTCQNDTDIRDPGMDLAPVARLFSLAQLDELKALAALVLLGADETPCQSRLEGFEVQANNLLLSTARDVVSGLFADPNSAALFKARRINKEKAIAFILYAAVGAEFPDDAEAAGKAGARVFTHLNSKALAKRRAIVATEAARQLHEAQKAMETPSVLARIERDRVEKLADIDREVYKGFLQEKVITEIGAKIAPSAVAPVAVVTRGAGHVDPHDAAIADLDEQFRQEWISKLEEREQELRAREVNNRELRAMMHEECDYCQEQLRIQKQERFKAEQYTWEMEVRLKACLGELAMEEEENERAESVCEEMLREKIKYLQKELADTRAELADLAEWRSMRILEIQRRLMCPRI